MKQIFFGLIVLGFSFTANAQETEAATLPTQSQTEKKTEVQSSSSSQERVNELRQAVQSIEARKKAISEDKTLSAADRKLKMEQLATEQDELGKKIRTNSTQSKTRRSTTTTTTEQKN